MSKKLKIVIACGSGVATSTLAAKGVKETCEEYGVNATIETCSMAEVVSFSRDADVVFTTNRCDKELSCPVESVIAFVTGIRVKQTQERIGALLTDLASN